MARGKKAKNGGKSKTTSRPKQLSNGSAFSSSARPIFSPSNHDVATFTLRDAAHNSEHPRSFWSSSGLSLRHRSMHFVPSNEPLSSETDLEYSLGEPRNAPLLPKPLRDPTADHTAVLQSVSVQDIAGISPPRDWTAEKNRSPEHAQQSGTAIANRSHTSSVSSDEVVFVGRNNSHKAIERSLPPVANMLSPQPQPSQNLSRHFLRKVTENNSSTSGIGNLVTAASEKDNDQAGISADIETKAVERTFQSPSVERQGRVRSRKRQMSSASSVDDNGKDVLDDYIANMLASGEFETAPELNGNDFPNRTEKSRWTPSDLEDFDDMSTSEDDVGTVQQILSKRYRLGKVQYLVVGKNRTTDDAKWIPRSALTMPGVAGLIETFENQEKYFYEHQKPSNDSSEEDPEIRWASDSDNDSSTEDDGDESFEDEKDLVQRRMARMTDEHIAKLFQKQDSLGLNSDELQLFDGIEDFELSEDALDDRSHVLSRKKRDQKRRKHQRDTYFDGEGDLILEGDDYGDFDIMDRERPSLSRTKGPHSDPFLLGISDSALAQDLRDTWAADRRKKRLKKQEREELRAQGLLGRKNKVKPDLKAKYNEGMSLSQIEEELENFLSNGQQDSLCLPPMAKQERKVIHEISNRFGLKSKSQGSNKKRFPILYKTSKTIEFDDRIFGQLRVQLRRRFLPRPDQKGRGINARPQRGGASGSGAGYRDGEIVGAAAPELGAENRGRAMLEKMGWSTGTALGALDNQGILTPIEHIVKNSRAGLG